MNAKQRQLRHADYLEHMLDAIDLAILIISDGVHRKTAGLVSIGRSGFIPTMFGKTMN